MNPPPGRTAWEFRNVTLIVVATMLFPVGCSNNGNNDAVTASEPISIPIAPSVEDIPQLVAALKTDDDKIVKQAADALAKLGPDAHEAVPEMIQALRYGTGQGIVTVNFNGEEIPYAEDK